MQSFGRLSYLYIVKAIRHLLLLSFLACATALYADHTFAVIISGGRSKLFNHERYWNDCAFLYRTLRQTYGIPKEHITLLMADGNNPADDQLTDGATGLASSPTDLDGDGEADLALAATRQNIDDTFRQLATRLGANDHLFLFITDHGECDQQGNVHLWLWGNEALGPRELAAMVGQCHPATMNILMGQCHSGAFTESLQGEGRIITTACAAGQMSWACKERPYDEFVYHWICAIAQHDETGQAVIADADGDGCVNMQEAYDYALRHDCRPETPSLDALPADIATQWSFTGMRNSISPPRAPTPTYDVPFIYDLQGRMIRKK